MKKFLFIICTIFIVCSCGVYTECVGNITTFTHSGDTLNVYKNVKIQSTETDIFKQFGLNFYDNESNKHIVISNATPYIIEYNVIKYDLTEETKTTPYGNDSSVIYSDYINTKEKIKEQKTLLNSVEPDSETYFRIKREIKNLNKELNNLSSAYYDLTGENL